MHVPSFIPMQLTQAFLPYPPLTFKENKKFNASSIHSANPPPLVSDQGLNKPPPNTPMFSLGPFPSHISRKRPRTKSPSKVDQTIHPISFNLNHPPPPPPPPPPSPEPPVVPSPLPQPLSPDFSSPLDFTSIPETQEINPPSIPPIPFAPFSEPPQFHPQNTPSLTTSVLPTNTQNLQDNHPSNQPNTLNLPPPPTEPCPTAPNGFEAQPTNQTNTPYPPPSLNVTHTIPPQGIFHPLNPREADQELEATLNIASFLGIDLGNNVQQVSDAIMGEGELSKHQ